MGVNVARHASDPVARLTIEISPKVHRCIIEMRSAGTPVLLEEALHKHSDGKIHGIENIFRRGRVKMGRAGDLILVSYDQRLARLRREVPRAEILSRKTDPRPGIPFSSEEIPEGCLAVIGEQEGEIFIIDRSFDRGRWQKSLSLSEWPRLDAGMDLIFYAFAEFGKLGKELVFPGELAAWRKRWPLDQGGGKMPEGAGEVAKRLVSRAGPEDKGQVNSENLKEIAEMDFSASPEVLTHRKNALRFFSESVVRILRERTGSPKSPIIAFQGRLPAGGEESRSEWHDDIITNYTSGPGDHEPHWLAKLVLYLEDQGFVVVRSREEYLRATEGWFARWGRRALGWFRQ